MPPAKIELMDTLKALKDAVKQGQEKFEKQMAGFELRADNSDKAVADLVELGKTQHDALEVIRQTVPAKDRDIVFPDGKPNGKPDRDLMNKQLKFMVEWMATPKLAPEAERKALSIDVGVDGGFLVPSVFQAEIIQKSIKSSIFRPNATIFANSPVKGDMGKENGDVTWFYVANNETITESNVTFDNLEWGLNTIAALSKISNGLLKHAGLDLAGWLSDKFGRSFSVEEDKRYMIADGSGKPLGLRNATGMTSVAQAGANIVATDLTSLKYALPQQYRDQAVWIMHDDLAEKVEKLEDSQNRPLFTNYQDPLFRAFNFDPVNSRGSLLGSPMFIQNDIPVTLGGSSDESEIFYGPLDAYYIWEGGQMEMATSTEADDAFKKNQTHMRVLFEHDAKLSLGEKMAILTAAT